MPIELPLGFQAAGVSCHIKGDPKKLDLALVVTDRPAVAAGVYTQNLICAAPVVIDRARTPSDSIRAIVANSGVANACTGTQGLTDARRMTHCVAEAIGAKEDQVLVLSTGVIGAMLPMVKIEAGIAAACAKLGRSSADLLSAARGMMTTDTVPKISERRLELEGHAVRVTGFCKGAAMIGPNMATMLGIVLTDASMAVPEAQLALVEAVDHSFHCISVEGHTSTNDSVLLLANGAAMADRSLGYTAKSKLHLAIRAVCEDLARAIVDDGEGTTHSISIEVRGCRNTEDAQRIARTIANSPLVKTAIAGADPNWGRILSAAGYSGVSFEPHQVRLELGGILLYDEGAPVPFDAAAVSQSIASQRNVDIVLTVGMGDAAAQFWTTDLTTEYVRLNAEYHT
ncbi:MAG: bifunctional glutamate N-acetyltransferase/amino-acid acetyltransferase ArgJ [Pirellulales bacterium]|nr:bifunctional glutamate N-acetyltransferase/amino-acid acetyltransferase ArgJ [Pirellulales bacterium]